MPGLDNITYPYGGAQVEGSRLSLDWLLANPDRITRVVQSKALLRNYVDLIFAPAGPVEGGARIYEQATENELYPQRDVRKIEPGDEFPLVTFDRAEALTAQVEKFGGKFPVTWEARRRNQQGRVNKAIDKLSNVIERKVQQRALAELTAAVTQFGRTAVSTSWLDDSGVAAGSKVATAGTLATLTAVEEANALIELGYDYDMAIMAPGEWRNFRLASGGSSSDARALLADSGISTVWVTNRKSAGSVYWLAKRQVGELGYELPIYTRTFPDPEGKEQDWYQTGVLPIVYVTDPYAILETTGHRA